MTESLQLTKLYTDIDEAFSVSFSGSYNKTYGTLATVIVFLVWLWISNIAVLLGLEFDAETQRERAICAGMPADVEPFAELRDTRKLDDSEKRRVRRRNGSAEENEQSVWRARNGVLRLHDTGVLVPTARSTPCC